MTQLKILGLSGSLRKESYNTKLLQAVSRLAPEGAKVTCASIAAIPLYNADHGDPEPSAVVELKQAIADADGLLIATPEYNYGIPGVLKNALDWVSRPAYRSVLAHKPVAILGASLGPVGTARAQGQLKQVLLGVVSQVFPTPEVTVGGVGDKMDPTGNVSDERTLQTLQRFIDGYCQWLSAQQNDPPGPSTGA